MQCFEIDHHWICDTTTSITGKKSQGEEWTPTNDEKSD
jgi:hypothetical protein